MKKLLFLLLFIPLMSIGQEDITVVQSKTSVSNSTNIENELVLSETNYTIKTPLTADLSNYTHILLVNINLYVQKVLPFRGRYSNDIGLKGGYDKYRNIYAYSPVQNLLEMGIFEIINPYELNRKRYLKEPMYLKTIKNESNLYLYINQTDGRGDDINTTIIIRDWKNKQIYNATYINAGLNEILSPLIDY